jgi:hypothetical protein
MEPEGSLPHLSVSEARSIESLSPPPPLLERPFQYYTPWFGSQILSALANLIRFTSIRLFRISKSDFREIYQSSTALRAVALQRLSTKQGDKCRRYIRKLICVSVWSMTSIATISKKLIMTNEFLCRHHVNRILSKSGKNYNKVE